MQASQSQLSDLEQRYQQLWNEVREQIQQANRLREKLRNGVAESSTSLQCELNHRPRPCSSSYWNLFKDYWRSFELFEEKLTAISQQLSLPLDLFAVRHTPPELATKEYWTDIVDDLEELRDTLYRQRAQRTSLLAVIDVLDSADRLLQLRIPQVRHKGQKFAKSFHALKGSVVALKRGLAKVLADCGVSAISLSLQDYPSPETTRIIARRDNNNHDDLMIVELVTTGYTWRAGLLRKADVVVASYPRSEN